MQKKYTFKLCVSLLQTKQKHNAHRICKEYIYLLRLRQLEFKTTDRSLMIIYFYKKYKKAAIILAISIS